MRRSLFLLALWIALTFSVSLWGTASRVSPEASALSLLWLPARVEAQSQITPTVQLVPVRVTETPLTTTVPTASPTATAELVPVSPTATLVSLPPSLPVTATVVPSPTATVAPLPPQAEVTETAIVSGTVIANRTPFTVTFFLEGWLYTLRPSRSVGVNLPRPASMLALSNCEPGTAPAQDQPGCLWDPYLVRRDGFYEIVNIATARKLPVLSLQEASPPATDQVWVHNRTGRNEFVLHGDSTYELPPGAVQEIELQGEEEPALFLRSCLVLADESACEWLPQPVRGGIYYALVETSVPGGLPDSQINAVGLQPILTQAGENLAFALQPSVAMVASEASIVTPIPQTSGQMTCRARVAGLNIRSGPGTQYLILSTVQRATGSKGVVIVRGRDQTGEWLAVDERIVAGGWIAGHSDFVTCDGDVMTLPIAKVTDGRLAPTPVPRIPTPTQGPQPTPEPTQPAVPPDKALLIVTNAYDREMVFTLSPNAWTLKPGESVTIEVEPGRITFSASTPFHSGNAEFVLKAGDVRSLWLHFVPETPGSEKFELRY